MVGYGGWMEEGGWWMEGWMEGGCMWGGWLDGGLDGGAAVSEHKRLVDGGLVGPVDGG